MNNTIFPTIESAIDEITALRAQLDQERAKVVALREVIEASGEWLPNSRGKLIFQFGGGWIANDETLALLSGRGEGQADG